MPEIHGKPVDPVGPGQAPENLINLGLEQDRNKMRNPGLMQDEKIENLGSIRTNRFQVGPSGRPSILCQ